jgi:Ca2+-binding EF-hand superfamily protein
MGAQASGAPTASESFKPAFPATALTPQQRLYTILRERKYLDNDSHQLYETIQHDIQAMDKGDVDADDLLDRLETEIVVEQETLARAFKLFDTRGKNALNPADVKNMNRYLGFPSEDADIQQIMKVIDEDDSGTITFEEFDAYVGKMGGTSKFFEQRQKRLMERAGSGALVSKARSENVVAALQQAGIDQEAQAYWKMVVPESEFEAAAQLVKCQKDAVSTIRRLAKRNHQEALPALQAKVHKFGFPDDHLWLTLAWIRELAPILLHIDIVKMLPHMEKDTHYRNQFETKTSGGLLKPTVREKWERDLFQGSYEKAIGFHRPKYGVQNVMNDYRGVVKAKQYGQSYLILKNVRLRCTFSPEDSANLKAERLAVLDFYAHVLNEYSEEELKETIKVANSADAALLGDSDKVGKMKYKEAQIHGEVALDKHVERLVAHTKHKGQGMEARLRAMCAKHGFQFSWMDEEQDRMRREAMHSLGGAAWQDRLQQLQESGGDVEVPQGFCKVGCGRQVCPGVTRAGQPFTTCCRGCIMGFGHDRLCGQIDPSKVGPGLCKNGCGLKIAPGCDAKGRPLTTCCRGCALGLDHDATCQKVLTPPEAGMCKVGCGRPVAPGTTKGGNPFDTCCRNCASGKGHSPSCIA